MNGDFACENKYLLTDVLKKEWAFRGFVVSDWGGTHSTVKASAAGLDNEEPLDEFLWHQTESRSRVGESFAGGTRRARSPRATRRVCVRNRRSSDTEGRCRCDLADSKTARKIEESSAVLLKNEGGVLPLNAASLKSIAIIGPHADAEMISGGGSAQVDAPGRPNAGWQAHVWFPTSPMKAVQAHAPHANVEFDSGAEVRKSRRAREEIGCRDRICVSVDGGRNGS